jgi:hypothetical protein
MAPKYLLVKGRAGLGNRIFAVLAAMLYAQLAGRRLVVDWSDSVYSGDRTNAFPRYFQSPWVDPQAELPATDSVSPDVWRGRLHLSTNELESQLPPGSISDAQADARNEEAAGYRRAFEVATSIDLTRPDYPDDIAVYWTCADRIDVLRRHYPSQLDALGLGGHDAILRQMLREDLVLHPTIRARVGAFKARHFSANTVGVHVRYTDHRVSLRRILRQLDVVLTREPGIQIFLATDNVQIVRMFQSAYPNVLTTSHWYPKPGDRIHDNAVCPSPFEAGADALVDLYLLAECQYLVVDTRTSFARLACLLSTAAPSNVYDAVDRPARDWTRGWYRPWRIWQRLGLFTWGLWIAGHWMRYRRRLT